jgi:cytolysin (calcineurin-like family phosphatase)
MKLFRVVKQFLVVMSLVVFPSMYIVAATQVPRHVVFLSDPQYPWSDLADAGLPDPGDNRARELIELQYSDVASFRRLNGGAMQIPVMINGDITAFGHGAERSYMKSVFEEKLEGYFDYGLGNHDYENNVDECRFPENNCAAGSIMELKEKYWGKVVNMDLAARSEEGAKVIYGSLAYSKTLGDVHLVQLNNEPTYAVSFTSGFPLSRVRFEITDSLDWLERDLQRARSQGKIIILNMHKPDRWKGGDEQIVRFKAIIERYKVSAVFAGHFHTEPGLYDGWNRRDYFGDVPVFLSGGASSQTYLIADIALDRKTLKVHQVNGNNWPSRKEIATVPVR